ncbi:MAG: hypothetical protein ACQEQF_05000 [Bacillota bacterium]
MKVANEAIVRFISNELGLSIGKTEKLILDIAKEIKGDKNDS